MTHPTEAGCSNPRCGSWGCENPAHKETTMEAARRFRKRPVVIEAVQWTGDNLREIIDFTGLHPSAEKWTWEEYEGVVADEGLKIFTAEGPLMASVGDWIIRGVQGEFYPCKPDIFEKTYEVVGPTEAGERERLAYECRQYAYTISIILDRTGDGLNREGLRNVETILRRAADLLHTEPGGGDE